MSKPKYPFEVTPKVISIAWGLKVASEITRVIGQLNQTVLTINPTWRVDESKNERKE